MNLLIMTIQNTFEVFIVIKIFRKEKCQANESYCSARQTQPTFRIASLL